MIHILNIRRSVPKPGCFDKNTKITTKWYESISNMKSEPF